MGVTYEPIEDVKPIVEKARIRYRIVRDPDWSMPRPFMRPNEAMPYGALIRRGTIVWEGHPAELSEPAIEEALRGAVVEPAWQIPEGLARERALLARKLYGQAARALEARRRAGGDHAAAAGRLLRLLKGYGEAVAREVGLRARAGDPFGALRIARSFDAAFAGWEGAASLGLARSGIERSGGEAALRAARAIEGAYGRVYDGEIEEARRLLLETAEGVPGTAAADRARGAAQRLLDWL